MDSTEKRTTHVSRRPQWDCRICRTPWPCFGAKAELLDDFRRFPSVLSIYLWAQFDEAVRDLASRGPIAPVDLYDRFVGWADDVEFEVETKKLRRRPGVP